MKLDRLVSSLALYDIAGTPGVAADVSHINTSAQVSGYVDEEQLGKALEGSDVVIIPAGVPRKPGMIRDDLFNINAGIVKFLCTAIAKCSPNEPGELNRAYCSEVFKKTGTYDERKLLGVTALDVVRAKTFYAGKAKATPASNDLSHEDIKSPPKRTQDGGTEVVEAELENALQLCQWNTQEPFSDACLKGLNGASVECSFVQSSVTELPFFASKFSHIVFGEAGRKWSGGSSWTRHPV